MKAELKKTYKCDFCKKHLFMRDAMERHEDVCAKNPINFVSCNGCEHIEEHQKDYQCSVYSDYSYGRTSKSFYCNKFHKGLYPPKAKNLAKRYPETFEDEELMPLTCEGFEAQKLPF